jgi:hypothetical protein
MKCARSELKPHFQLRILTVIGLCAVTCLTGCGGGDPATAKTSGSVKANGKDVPGGEVIFEPMAEGKSQPGKTTIVPVEEDGTFVVTTYKENDGAIIGKHRIRYNAPQLEPGKAAAGGHVATRTSPFAGLVPKVQEIEIKPGDNVIEVELVRAGKPG